MRNYLGFMKKTAWNADAEYANRILTIPRELNLDGEYATIFKHEFLDRHYHI